MPSLRAFTAPTLLILCGVLPVSIAITNIVLGVLSALLALRGVLGGRVQWGRARNAAMAALMLYCGVAVTCAWLGLRPDLSLRCALKDFHKLWVIFLFLIALADDPVPQACRVFGASFGFLAVLGVFQAVTQRFGDSWMRAHGFVHPVTYGEQLALAALGGFCFFDRRESGTDTPGLRRAMTLFLGAVGVALALNQTRGALLGLIVGFAAACFLYKPLRGWSKRLAVSLIIVLLLWFLIPMGGRSLSRLWRAPTLSAAAETLFGGRRILWSVAWRVFKDHPATGVGPGNFRTVFTQYFQGVIERESIWGSAHNLYLHQLAERGLVGFAALLLVLGVLMARAYSRALDNPNPWNLWAFSALVAFLAMNLSEVAFQNEQISAFVLFIWAWSEANALA